MFNEMNEKGFEEMMAEMAEIMANPSEEEVNHMAEVWLTDK